MLKLLWNVLILTFILAMARICNDIRKLVVRKIIAGMKQREVSKLLEMNYITVHYIWEKYLNASMVVDKPRCGRPMISTERNRRELCRHLRKNPFATATEVERAVDSLKFASISTIKKLSKTRRTNGSSGYRKTAIK